MEKEKINIQVRKGEIFVYLEDCKRYIRDAFKSGALAQRKKELEFLKEWNAGDLIKQATEERSHYYVASRAKMIQERIKLLKDSSLSQQNES